MNPARGLFTPLASPSRQRVLGDAELKKLWRALDQFSPQFAAVIRLLILLGQRRQEVTGMRWDELSDDMSVWTIDAARVKNKRAHIVPLPAIAQRIVSSMPRIAGSQFVFTVNGANSINGFSEKKRMLDGLIEPKEDWVYHDLRRTCVSGMARTGVPPHHIEAVVNHQSGFRSSVAGIYNRHGYEDEKREALQLWADRVAKIVA